MCDKVKLHRYMNAAAVSVIQAPSAHDARTAAAAAAVSPSVIATTSSTLPIARCRVIVPPRPVEPYYNDIACPGTTATDVQQTVFF